MNPNRTLADTPRGYGPVSRTLHWGMALLFAWQFVGAALHVLAGNTQIEEFFWVTHYSVGFTLWALVFFRGAWGLANLRRRPKHNGPPLETMAAAAGHLTLYILMVVVPTLAILRAVGNGRGMSVYGIQIIERGGEPNSLLTTPGNLAHGFLGWTLLVVVAGHAAMALYHGLVRRDGTLERMVHGRTNLSWPERDHASQ